MTDAYINLGQAFLLGARGTSRNLSVRRSYKREPH